MRHRIETCIALVVLLLSPLAIAAEVEDKIQVADEPETLVWHNREIFTFRAEVDDYGPAERVRSALRRLNAIEIGTLPPETITRRVLGAMSIQAANEPLFLFVKEDLPPDQTLDEAAELVKSRLDEAFAAYAQTHSRGFLVRAGTKTATSTVIFLVVFLVLLRVGRAIVRRLPDPEHPRLQKLQVTGFSFGPYAAAAGRAFVRTVFLVLQLFALYLWLTYVMEIFPYTRPWGEASAEFLIGMFRMLALGAITSIPGLITVVVIFVLTRAIVRIVKSFFDAVESRTIEVMWLQPETSGATKRLVVAIIWIFSITVAYPYIPGSGTDAFKGVSVFVGLMVSLGSAGLVNQVMSGLVVVYSKAFKPGELIRVNDVEGAVSEIGVLSTKLVTKKLEEITIPNAVLVNTMTKNYSSKAGDTGVILYTSVTIGYDTPWRQVHAMLLLAAERTSGVRSSPKPFVFQTALSDFYAEYQLNVHMEDPQRRGPVLSELHAHIQDVFNEFGVQIMSPNFVAQPDQLVLSPKEKWFEPPARRPEKDQP